MSFNYAYQKPKVIAEIGCNHMGNFEIARELIALAKDCGADIAKFQKRDNKLLLTEEKYNSPHPVEENSYGNTYGEHRDYLEFDHKQHQELKSELEKIDKDVSNKFGNKNNFNKKIDELNQETETLIDEIEK